MCCESVQCGVTPQKRAMSSIVSSSRPVSPGGWLRHTGRSAPFVRPPRVACIPAAKTAVESRPPLIHTAVDPVLLMRSVTAVASRSRRCSAASSNDNPPAPLGDGCQNRLVTSGSRALHCAECPARSHCTPRMHVSSSKAKRRPAASAPTAARFTCGSKPGSAAIESSDVATTSPPRHGARKSGRRPVKSRAQNARRARRSQTRKAKSPSRWSTQAGPNVRNAVRIN